MIPTFDENRSLNTKETIQIETVATEKIIKSIE